MSDKIAIFNPDRSDFTVNYDVDGNKKPKSFTAPGMKISYFNPIIANHLAKHLANYLLNKRGLGGRSSEEVLDGIMKEIKV